MKLKSTIFIIFFLYLLNIIFCQEESNEGNDDTFIKDCVSNGSKGKKINDVKCCEVNFKINGKGFTLFTPIYDKLSSIKEYKKMLRDAKDVTIDCSEFFLSFYKIMIFLLVFLF